MAGDAPTNQRYEPMRGFTLTLSYNTVAQARPIFEALAEGGRITSPALWARGSECASTASARRGSSTAA
jgi:PhnB protein